VLAVPVGPIEALEEVRAVADAVYAIESPADFYSIGEWYVDFREVTDEDVERILAESAPLPA
jgi:predicted phosphoribosyltransferase